MGKNIIRSLGLHFLIIIITYLLPALYLKEIIIVNDHVGTGAILMVLIYIVLVLSFYYLAGMYLKPQLTILKNLVSTLGIPAQFILIIVALYVTGKPIFEKLAAISSAHISFLVVVTNSIEAVIIALLILLVVIPLVMWLGLLTISRIMRAPNRLLFIKLFSFVVLFTVFVSYVLTLNFVLNNKVNITSPDFSHNTSIHKKIPLKLPSTVKITNIEYQEAKKADGKIQPEMILLKGVIEKDNLTEVINKLEDYLDNEIPAYHLGDFSYEWWDVNQMSIVYENYSSLDFEKIELLSMNTNEYPGAIAVNITKNGDGDYYLYLVQRNYIYID